MIEDIEFLDDSTRPKADKLEITSDHQRDGGRHLKQIHDQFRDLMILLRKILEKVENGEASPQELHDQTAALPMLHNLRRFGNLCGQHCRIIEMHHTIEDQALFPILGQKSNSLKRVIDRLIAEHEVVHALLLRLIEASERLVRDPAPANFAATKELYEAFEKVLLSHFGYEEEEIGDAIGVYNIRL
jgi:hemerythrin-like domain-containing protein